MSASGIDYNEKVVCRKCGKLKNLYAGGHGFCQKCYRELLDEYSYYDYGRDKNRIRGTELKVCEMLIEQGVDRKEIHKILGLNAQYVRMIVNKNCIRVNANGEKRPF